MTDPTVLKLVSSNKCFEGNFRFIEYENLLLFMPKIII